MSISKRDFLAIGAAAGASFTLPAWAQAKPLIASINMFVPAAPGGGWDGTARAIERAAKAAGLVGTMQFENVGGAGGMVGLPRYVNQRKGQGNSLMVGGSVMIGAGIANKSPVTIKDVTPIARLTEEAGVIVVPANGKIKTWKELEAAIKANPKAVSVAGGSAGGTDHLILGMLIKALGKNPREAAYVAFAGGGPANAAILGGQVSAGISG
jgi:putative tricarboxylic transport membrane protein